MTTINELIGRYEREAMEAQKKAVIARSMGGNVAIEDIRIPEPTPFYAAVVVLDPTADIPRQMDLLRPEPLSLCHSQTMASVRPTAQVPSPGDKNVLVSDSWILSPDAKAKPVAPFFVTFDPPGDASGYAHMNWYSKVGEEMLFVTCHLRQVHWLSISTGGFKLWSPFKIESWISSQQDSPNRPPAIHRLLWSPETSIMAAMGIECKEYIFG